MNRFVKFLLASVPVIAVVAAASIAIAQESQPNTESAGTLSRLQMTPLEDGEKKEVKIQGRVKVQNKYSILVETAESEKKVIISDKTRVVLKLASPRIDFAKKQLIINVQDADKEFKAYKFNPPLFVRVDFAHKNQQSRIMGLQEKRIPNYTLSKRPLQPLAADDKLFLIGELVEGRSNRQHKLKTQNQIHEVVLTKRGRFTGFSVANLAADRTYVQVTGAARGEVVEATEILFWPVAKQKDSETVDD